MPRASAPLGAQDILVLVDGDTVFAPDALTWLARRITEPGVGAVSGNTKVANRRGLLGRWQHLSPASSPRYTTPWPARLGTVDDGLP